MLSYIHLNDRLFLRNPQETELGRRLIGESVRLIDEIGLEQFTFKKLAQRMESTEASLYRYFENKHRLLGYLVSWYWAWLGHQIRFHTHNVPNPAQRLRLILGILTRAHHDDPTTTGLDEAALYRIVVNEASKAYLTRGVDADDQAGLFREYKQLVAHISAVLGELNPAYPYPHALASTLLEASRKQLFFAQHLPSLTNQTGQPTEQVIYCFLENLAFKALA
ncbi:TetR/AcrR family transcriptional regulator [Hymenobacter taeanensis]|uniref:TetR/AcrR family transcriptional regulator n=1 Tax=Hymenobacter taeanensis TaxID=2735321 RepID=A0A6M6BJ92_9BACT|nr:MULTISPECIES: TetR/AcrR family transcriptional regulator [Hymenobacter]QJX48187.1 TetR/AcrR family transcriptional regulator [Hymenobacter taeanensis]UOQ82340.1 TetR/AcrR family transcriptional regulator [Hymenobacter sp. 5414T-23]